SLTRWKKNPQELWQDVHDLSADFVTSLADAVKEEEKKQKAAAEAAKAAAAAKAAGKPAPKAKESPPPLDGVLAKHPSLKAWKNGFFTLEWELVEALHDQGFVWGATFGDNVDLHHFELPSPEE